MMKVLTFIYAGFFLLLTVVGCGSLYSRKTKLQAVNTIDNYEIKCKIQPENLFQLRIFETKSYVIDGKSIEEGFVKYLQATGVQKINEETDKEVVEETYLYLDGISEHKKEGTVIYMETYPIIATPRSAKLRNLREHYFNNPYKIHTNIIKKCYIGAWKKENDFCVLSLRITHGSVAKEYKIRGKYRQNNENSYFTMYQITHPQVFKANGTDGEGVRRDIAYEYINLNNVLGFNKVPIEVNRNQAKFKFNASSLDDYIADDKVKKGHVNIFGLDEKIKDQEEQGLLFFNVPKEKKIITSNDIDNEQLNLDSNNVITHLGIRFNRLYFISEHKTFVHTNSERLK